MNHVYKIDVHGRHFGFSFYDLPKATVHPSRHVVFHTTQPFATIPIKIQGLSTSKYNSIFSACSNVPADQRIVIDVEDSFIIPVSANFYHLLIDCLPRFYGALLDPHQNITICKTILGRYPRLYEIVKTWIPHESWNDIEIDLSYNPDGNDRSIRERIRGNFRFFASVSDKEAQIISDNRALAVAFWQRWYAAHYEQQPKERNIFLARTPGPGGSERCTNQREIFELLEKEQGFEWVDPMDYSFDDLAKIINGARKLVGVHGAGMANTVFCQPHIPYIQLSNDSGSELFYETIAKHCLARYDVIRGVHPETGEPVYDNKSGTYVIDPQEILKLL
jgi:hypothetical protein